MAGRGVDFTGLICAVLLAAPPGSQPVRPGREVRVDGDAQQRYLLHGPRSDTPPKDGYRVLLVLPGGDGSADFAWFVHALATRALDERYLVAELIAPVFNARQARRRVWPTRINPWPGMTFSTEQFIDAVVEDLAQRYPIDRRYVFALGWSSSGPAVYCAQMREKTPLTGVIISSAKFREDWVPPLELARGRRFYILHSPDDWIPIETARKARGLLRARGARVKLRRYRGGHGWHGDAAAQVRSAVRWLEKRIDGPASRPAGP